MAPRDLFATVMGPGRRLGAGDCAYNQGMDRLRPWVLPVGLLVIAALAAAAMVASLRASTRPVADLAGTVGTQVARLLQPSPTVMPDPVTVVREVRSLARLETIQYTLEKVITAETGEGVFGFLFGDRLLLVAHGVVIAGVDLGHLGPQDVAFDPQGRVYLQLPPAEIFVATLDNDKSYIFERQTGLLRRGDIHLEEAARRAAEEEIRRAALDDGILAQASVNAEAVVYRLMRSLGFSDVLFERAPATPAPQASPTPH